MEEKVLPDANRQLVSGFRATVQKKEVRPPGAASGPARDGDGRCGAQVRRLFSKHHKGVYKVFVHYSGIRSHMDRAKPGEAPTMTEDGFVALLKDCAWAAAAREGESR